MGLLAPLHAASFGAKTADRCVEERPNSVPCKFINAVATTAQQEIYRCSTLAYTQSSTQISTVPPGYRVPSGSYPIPAVATMPKRVSTPGGCTARSSSLVEDVVQRVTRLAGTSSRFPAPRGNMVILVSRGRSFSLLRRNSRQQVTSGKVGVGRVIRGVWLKRYRFDPICGTVWKMLPCLWSVGDPLPCVHITSEYGAYGVVFQSMNHVRSARTTGARYSIQNDK